MAIESQLERQIERPTISPPADTSAMTREAPGLQLGGAQFASLNRNEEPTDVIASNDSFSFFDSAKENGERDPDSDDEEEKDYEKHKDNEENDDDIPEPESDTDRKRIAPEIGEVPSTNEADKDNEENDDANPEPESDTDMYEGSDPEMSTVSSTNKETQENIPDDNDDVTDNVTVPPLPDEPIR